MKVTLTDKATVKLNSRRVKDSNGFLRLPIQMARTGVQYYFGIELGLKDRAMEKIGVYRDPSEVFKPESMSTAKDIDITLMPNGAHPEDFVTPDSWKDLPIIGHITSEGREENGWLVADAIIKDADGIKLAESGKDVYVSPGYSMDLVQKDGFDPNTGEKYEYVQRDIVQNHLSVVDHPRGGSGAKFTDRGIEMTKVKLSDGASVTVADENAAVRIQDCIDGLVNQIGDTKEKLADAEEEKAKAEAKADMAEEEKEKETKAKDAAISELNKILVSQVLDSAKLIAGEKFTFDSTDPVEIKRAALSDAYPKKDWGNLPAAVITFAYDQKMEEEEEKKEKAKDSHNAFGKDANSVEVTDAQTARDAARAEFEKKRYGKEQ